MAVDIVFDGGFGSSGKGKLAALLATGDVEYYIAATNNSVQAGHTARINGKEYMVQHLPMGMVVNEHIKGAIGPDSVIDPDVFQREVETLLPSSRHGELWVHPNAAIIQQRHKDWEAGGMKHIASTMKGVGACRSEKILRGPNVMLAKDHPYVSKFVCNDVSNIVRDEARYGNVLLETAQGMWLDINHGFYPYTTSTMCHPCAELARWGIPHTRVRDIILCLRTYPIRVGNVEGGFSGPIFYDQEELTWEQVTERAKSETPLIERTTVTKRVRRVFTFSYEAAIRAVEITGANKIYLSFVDYINASVSRKSTIEEMTKEVWDFVDRLEDYTGVKVNYLSTGPDNSHTVFVP